jgi:hypothetical protein
MWVTQDAVRDILLFFAGDRKLFPAQLQDQPGVGGLKGNIHEGAKQMLNLPNVPKFEGAVVEAILGELMRLPAPAHPTVYYSCMLIELCKLQSTIHPALGAAINYLFDALPQVPLRRPPPSTTSSTPSRRFMVQGLGFREEVVAFNYLFDALPQVASTSKPLGSRGIQVWGFGGFGG